MGYSRLRYIVDAWFQFKFIFVFIVVALCGNITTLLFFNYIALKKLDEFRWTVHVNVQSMSDTITSLFIYTTIFNIVFLSMLLFITGGLLIHKMNRPILRIIKSIKLLEEGDYASKIGLRKGDVFRDVAESLEEMKRKIHKTAELSRSKYNDISRGLIELEIAYAKDLPVKERTADLIFKVHEIQKMLHYN